MRRQRVGGRTNKRTSSEKIDYVVISDNSVDATGPQTSVSASGNDENRPQASVMVKAGGKGRKRKAIIVEHEDACVSNASSATTATTSEPIIVENKNILNDADQDQCGGTVPKKAKSKAKAKQVKNESEADDDLEPDIFINDHLRLTAQNKRKLFNPFNDDAQYITSHLIPVGELI